MNRSPELPSECRNAISELVVASRNTMGPNGDEGGESREGGSVAERHPASSAEQANPAAHSHAHQGVRFDPRSHRLRITPLLTQLLEKRVIGLQQQGFLDSRAGPLAITDTIERDRQQAVMFRGRLKLDSLRG